MRTTLNFRLMVLVLSGALALIACGKSKGSGDNRSGAGVSFYPGQLPPNAYGQPGYALPGYGRGQTQIDPEFDSYGALNGQGQFVNIGRGRYFVPNEQGPDWAPIRDGRWTSDDRGRTTWNSNEAFGQITDHRGLWRHHRQHKWVWTNFPDNHYEPNVVSFFESGEGLGWTPYRSDLNQIYAGTENDGFDDGYQNGEDNFGTDDFGNQFGVSVIPRRAFAAPNVRSEVIARRLPHRRAPRPRVTAERERPVVRDVRTRSSSTSTTVARPVIARPPAPAPVVERPAPTRTPPVPKPAKARRAGRPKVNAMPMSPSFDPNGFTPVPNATTNETPTTWIDPKPATPEVEAPAPKAEAPATDLPAFHERDHNVP